MSTRSLHLPALGIASCHFMLCSVLAAVVVYISMGYTLSDASDVPAQGFVILDRVLQLLEAPVVVVLRLLYHPTARFAPPNYFAVDLVGKANFLVTLALCALWSTSLGYLTAYAFRRVKVKAKIEATSIPSTK